MRNYWLRIGLGALVVFVIGFGLIQMIGLVKHKVVHALSGTDPIPFPLAFVEFKLDGQNIGSVSRAVLLRDTPEHINGLTVVVAVPESSRGRLSDCILSLDDGQAINSRTTFRCRKAADTVGLGLTPFARIALKGSTDTFPLLLPKDAVKSIQDIRIRVNGHGMEITSTADSLQAVADSIEAVTDSVREAISDSLHQAADRLTDSLT
ncbi:MAG: hypothetical protein ACHQ2E_10605, partial [Gemmatimonadales bacterium]